MTKRFVPFYKVELLDGFWKDRYNLNKDVSIESVKQRFSETNRFEALRFTYKEKKDPIHFFYDSDVAKWIEAVAYLIIREENFDKQYEEFIDELVDSMEKNQMENGYLNSFHQQVEPENIFKIRDHHELYCLGHFIEAAVAYDYATKKPKLLNIIKKYVDHVYDIFYVKKCAPFDTPGHEEIELALYKLYLYTKEEKYKKLADFFLLTRGKSLKDKGVWNGYSNYSQDNTDIYHLESAVGHCVRALYLYSGASDKAYIDKDIDLFNSLNKVYDDIINTKLYITGAVGSTHNGESFTVSYDLPNTAYAESCCAMAFNMFSLRMRLIDKNVKYGHLIERINYNLLLSSTSLSGKGFFYENPLEIVLEDYDREIGVPKENRTRLPIKERLEVFDCSCCPPNIARWFAEFGQSICFDDEISYIEQYISSLVKSSYGDIEIKETYALDGKCKVASKNYTKDKIAFRMPEWSTKVDVLVNGNKIETNIVEGYLYIDVNNEFEIDLDFNIKPRFIRSHSFVNANAGKVALTYGPLVYCVEAKDNVERLHRLRVLVNNINECKIYKDFHGFNSIEIDGLIDKSNKSLYFDINEEEFENIKIKYIPYFAFANRGESSMQIYIRYIK